MFIVTVALSEQRAAVKFFKCHLSHQASRIMNMECNKSNECLKLFNDWKIQFWIQNSAETVKITIANKYDVVGKTNL